MQRRKLHISESQSNKLLNSQAVPISEHEFSPRRDYFVEVTIHRTHYAPCIITSTCVRGENPFNHAKSHPIQLDGTVTASTLLSISSELHCTEKDSNSLERLLTSLLDLFFTKEAFSLRVQLSRTENGDLAVTRPDFNFDDAAVKRGNRQQDLVVMRDVTAEIFEEVEAEKDGIVYIR